MSLSVVTQIVIWLYVPDLSASVASSYKSQSLRPFGWWRKTKSGNRRSRHHDESLDGGRPVGLETPLYH